MQKQAAGQQVAAAKKQAAQRAAERKAADVHRAAADARKRAQVKAAADRRARATSWTTPTTGYVLGAGYAQSGPHWAHTHSGQDFVSQHRDPLSGPPTPAPW